MTKKILLLGSGELGKEFVIAAQRLGQYVIACDAYANAPAYAQSSLHGVECLYFGTSFHQTGDADEGFH